MAESTGNKPRSKNSNGTKKVSSKASVKVASDAEKSIALETKNAVNKFATISDVRAAISNLGEIHMEPYDVIRRNCNPHRRKFHHFIKSGILLRASPV